MDHLLQLQVKFLFLSEELIKRECKSSFCENATYTKISVLK